MTLTFLLGQILGEKYGLQNCYILVVEGSLHKFLLGQNAYNGFYNLKDIVEMLIGILNNHFEIQLPDYNNWYLKRVDISKCFDLGTQENVKNYINNLKLLDYPRRKPQHYKDCGLYFSGTTTTLKIYNKLLEFNKNDRYKLKDKQFFDIFQHTQKIKGFVRFEVEIKNKKLLDMFQKKYGAIVKNVRCKDFEYFDFEGIWVDDFMKVIKVNFNGMKLISDKEEVEKRLLNIHGSDLGRNLYNFYLSLVIDGYQKVRDISTKSTFYRKVNKLKNAGVDFSSNNYDIVYKNNNEVVDIFNMCEVS